MRFVLTIFFFILFVGNTPFWDWYYPDSGTIEAEWYKWDAGKKKVNELIFFIGLLISLCNKTFWSYIAILIVLIFVGCSVIDKARGINDYHIHDIFVALGALFIAREIYFKKLKNVI